MKKILVLLLLFFSFLAGFSQTGNDTTKYTWYKYTYGNRLQRYWADSVIDIPHDTTHSKYGLARKHDSVYVGNGIRWTLISSISPVDTVTVTPIGTGSPQIQTLWASGDGNLRTARLIPGVFMVPFQNGDSAYGVDADTTALATWNGITSRGGFTNIYNTNGTLTGDRYLSGPLAAGVPTKTLYFDSLFQFYINASGLGNGVDIYGLANTSHLQVGSNEITETAFNVPTDKVSYNDLQGDSSRFSVYTSGDTSRITLSPNYMNFYQFNGVYRFRNLVQANDTTTYKPLAANSAGTVKRMDGWAGSGGGGSTNAVGRDTVTTITSGTASTVPNGTNVIRFNSTTLLTYTLTLPTTWHTSNDLLIAFTANGTITNGNNMVTLTIVNGSGQTLSQALSPDGLTYKAGEIIRYHLISTIDQRTN